MTGIALRTASDSSPARPAAPAGPTIPPAAGPGAVRAMPPARQIVGFICMVFGMFMAILDIQIVSSSLSEIQAGLAASADEISWVQTSYLIAEIVMIPLSGTLSRLLSTRVLFTASAAAFTVMSCACAFASGMGQMVVFRALQGFLGGAMIPTVFATSFMLFPGTRRAGVSVLIGLVATLAPTIGPTLGGYLTQAFSWHWLFLINVFPGIIVVLAVWNLVDVDKGDRSLIRDFDWFGLLFMAVFLGSLEYVMDEGPRNDWFQDESVFRVAVAGTLAGVLFFWRVLRFRQPIVDLHAFFDRNFAVGCLFSFVLGIGLYGSVYLVPLFLGRVRGLNSMQIGEIMFVTGLFQFVSAPLAGMLSKRIDLRLMLAVGLGMFGFGVYSMTFMTADWGFREMFVPQAIRGMSLMLCFLPINSLALGTLPPHLLKNASGLYNLTRNLGGAIGLALINTVLQDRMALHWTRLADAVNLARPLVQDRLDGMAGRLGTAIGGDSNLAAIRMLAQTVQRQAMVMTFNDCLLLMAGVFGCALVLTPLIRRPRAAKPAAEAH